MEDNTTTTAQETATETTQVQPDNTQTSAPQTGQFDTAQTLQAIKDWKAGITNPQPVETAPVITPETAPKADAAPVAETEKAAPFNPETYLTETTKGLYKTPEELTKAVEKLQSLETNPYAALPENEAQILQAIKQFENPQDYFAFQSKDFTAMDSETVLREKFQKENPDWKGEDLEAAFQADLLKKYPALEGYDESDINYKMAARDRDKEAEAARTAFTKQQEEGKIKLPEPLSSEEQEKQFNQHLNAVKSELEGFNEMKIQVDADGSEITLGIEGKEQIEKAMANPAAFIESRWLNADGSYNLNQLKQDAHFLINREANNKQIYLAGGEAKLKGFIDEKLKNPTPLQPSVNPENTGTLDETLNAIKRAKQNFTSKI